MSLPAPAAGSGVNPRKGATIIVASFSAVDSVLTTVPFDVVDEDEGGFASLPNLVVPALPGVYAIVGRLDFPLNAAGNRIGMIAVNGAEVARDAVGADRGLLGITGISITLVPTIAYELVAGDVVTMTYQQTSGGPLAASSASLAMYRVAQ